MNGDVRGQYLAVDHKRRHLVLRVDFQVLGREILPLEVIERPDLEIGARFGERDIGASADLVLINKISAGHGFFPRLDHRRHDAHG
jgi:hypothetical protein